MENVAVITGIIGVILFTYFRIYKHNMEKKELSPAEKHYLSMKKAQKKYYEKKMDEKGPRKSKGRPRKIVDEVKDDSLVSV